jgi:inward rectifier potassium channel
MAEIKQRIRKRRITLGDRDVVTHSLAQPFWQDIYYYAMTANWPQFFGAAGLLFVLLNLVFGGLYALGESPVGNLFPNNFWGYFFFSVETLATVGYGDMHPQTLYGHLVSTVEIFIGMGSIALITGLVFARFSRPRSSIIFAEHPVAHMAEGRQMLMIRMANSRQNIISEASSRLRMLRNETTASGHYRKLADLKLERDQHPLFVLGWTVMHVIDETSPLYGQSPEQLKALDASLILSIEGVDETTNQTIRARQYYPCEEIRWGHRYVDMFSDDEEGTQHIHYLKFHESEPLDAQCESPDITEEPVAVEH